MSVDVFMHGQRIGALYQRGWKEYGFAYSLDVVERMSGEPLLSYSLPVRGEPYSREEVAPYIDGLLPSGPRRLQLASDLGLHDPDDRFALISAIGRDCPGAVSFLPKGTQLDPDQKEEPVWLDDYDLEELIGEEPTWLCDPEDPRRMRFTLPGERHKLALVYDEQGDRWAWPTAKLPSTHIIKPQPYAEGMETMPFNEYACTTAMREVGLPVAHAEVRPIAGRPCLISRRFDRWGAGRHAQRLHYESFSQALGYAPGDRNGLGPGFAESRVLLEAIGEEQSIEELFAAGYGNFLLGNWDEPHGMNGGILYTEVGPILAPFHDFFSSILYEDPSALYTLEEMARRNSCLVGMAPVGIECGYALQPTLKMAIEVTRDLCCGLSAVAESTPPERWWDEMIDQVMRRVIDRFKELGEEIEMLRPPGMLNWASPEDLQELIDNAFSQGGGSPDGGDVGEVDGTDGTDDGPDILPEDENQGTPP